MADTSIEWTSKVWNPVRGCSRVSKGCDNCYAMRMAHRHSGPGRPYEGLTTIRKGKVDWMGSARFVPEQLAAPFGWKKSRMIFVNSMSDLFHESLDFEHIAACFGVMAAANWHTYQVLTKRIDRVPEFFRWLDGWNFEDGSVRVERLVGAAIAAGLPEELVPSLNATWPLPNVWLGVSVENQKAADERIPLLLRCPAAIRWI
ncbi:MAG TPA: DUF5131 family protein, partial [Polyangiaceae bacterium]|nr:DUF5131 family protein [Polyangiaceae bacterium]